MRCSGRVGWCVGIGDCFNSTVHVAWSSDDNRTSALHVAMALVALLHVMPWCWQCYAHCAMALFFCCGVAHHTVSSSLFLKQKMKNTLSMGHSPSAACLEVTARCINKTKNINQPVQHWCQHTGVGISDHAMALALVIAVAAYFAQGTDPCKEMHLLCCCTPAYGDHLILFSKNVSTL